MFTSETPNKELNNSLPEWHDPFPEPQTIPSGWDLSEARSISARAYPFSTASSEMSAEN